MNLSHCLVYVEFNEETIQVPFIQKKLEEIFCKGQAFEFYATKFFVDLKKKRAGG